MVILASQYGGMLYANELNIIYFKIYSTLNSIFE